jgi:hypothetical protein
MNIDNSEIIIIRGARGSANVADQVALALDLAITNISSGFMAFRDQARIRCLVKTFLIYERMVRPSATHPCRRP